MSTLEDRLGALTPERLRGIRRGLEKESLRSQANGALALTPHPVSLGSALTHPHITTDFSESQLELVTGVHGSVDDALAELAQIHQVVYRELAAQGDEMLWASSMPCGLPVDETIPLGRYGGSNVGRAKSVYRMGLAHRYGRRMQTISGIHYNWSLPGVSNDEYFALIRNFRRHAVVLLYLFGASPAVCSNFVAERQHELQSLGKHAMHLPYATSLRMGRLGYQSDAQGSLAVSYNCLGSYAASLEQALTQPYPVYEAIGIHSPGGEYNQLATTLLQIENEFYGTIRPKRVIRPGERPLHALRERGVEYVEVRLMDLNPFEPMGIGADTMRFLDLFLLYCLLSDSPPDTPEEIAHLKANQHMAAAFGREPGRRFMRNGQSVLLADWVAEVVGALLPLAARMDAIGGDDAYTRAVLLAKNMAEVPGTLPSARVLQSIRHEHDGSFIAFACARSLSNRASFLQQDLSAETKAQFDQLARQSVVDQQRIEAMDSMPFEIYRREYVSPKRLGLPYAGAMADSSKC
jgi:glutamate--cysteine ligase